MLFFSFFLTHFDSVTSCASFTRLVDNYAYLNLIDVKSQERYCADELQDYISQQVGFCAILSYDKGLNLRLQPCKCLIVLGDGKLWSHGTTFQTLEPAM